MKAYTPVLIGIALMSGLLACHKDAVDVEAPVSFDKIQQITYESKSLVPPSAVDAFVKNLSTSIDKAAYTIACRYDSTGRLISRSDQTLIYQPDRVLRCTASEVCDTLYLNDQRLVARTGTFRPTYDYPWQYQYDSDGYLIAETGTEYTGCDQPQPLKITHRIADRNRVATTVNHRSTGERIEFAYEYDSDQLNPSLGFDTYRMFSTCSGMFNGYGDPGYAFAGTTNQNLIRKAIRSNYAADKLINTVTYTYYYDLDNKKRITHILVTARSDKAAYYDVHRRTYSYKD